MSVRALPPPEEWSAKDEQLAKLGREELKLLLVFFGGPRVGGNTGTPKLVEKLMTHLKSLPNDDVRLLLPFFFDDVLLPEAVAKLQDHCDADTEEWHSLMDHVLLGYKDPEAAARAGVAKPSALVEQLRSVTEEERAKGAGARERRAARALAASETVGTPVKADARGGRGGTKGGQGGSIFVGKVTGGLATGAPGATVMLSREGSESVLQDVLAELKEQRTAQAQTRELLMRMQQQQQQQQRVTRVQLQPYVDALGSVQAQGKDAHMLASLWSALDMGYEAMFQLAAAHPKVEGVQAGFRALEVVLGEWVLRGLAAQKGWGAVEGFDMGGWLGETVEKRVAAIRAYKAKSGKKSKGQGWPRAGPGPIAAGWVPGVGQAQPGAQAQIMGSAWSPQPVPQVWPQQQWGSPGWSQPAAWTQQPMARPVAQPLVQGWGPQVGAQVGPSSGAACFVCKQPGHYASRCPSAVCVVCGTAGTTSKFCPVCAQARAGTQSRPQ